jgi:hypothetical protein
MTDMDVLVMEDFVIDKRAVDQEADPTQREEYLAQFQLD